MGWQCNNCGNTEDFIETNRVETRVTQEAQSSRIVKILNKYTQQPLLDVRCARCENTNVVWKEVHQDDTFLHDQEEYVSQIHHITTGVLELTTRSDIDDIYNSQEPKDMPFEHLKRILDENARLPRPISFFELGWDKCNPLLYPQIKEILSIFEKNHWSANVLTNGKQFLHLMRDIPFQDNITITFFLDHPEKSENDTVMGEGVYDGTLSSLSFLHKRGIRTAIYMRVGNHNYSQVEKMNELCKEVSVGTFIPIEIYPLGDTKEDYSMTDDMKRAVLKTIQRLDLSTSIHFAPAQIGFDCTYQQRSRLLIDINGNISFCHFLRTLPHARITNDKNLSLLEYIQLNNKARVGFLRNKERLFNNWQQPRQTASPCSYCLHAFGLEKRW